MSERIIIAAFSALLGLGCFGAIVWILLDPEGVDVDTIFAFIACLLMGLIFLGLSAWMVLHTRLRELWRGQPVPAPEPKQKTAPAKGKVEEAAPAATEPMTEAAGKRAS